MSKKRLQFKQEELFRFIKIQNQIESKEDWNFSHQFYLKVFQDWLLYGRTRDGEVLTSASMAADVLERDGLDWFIKHLNIELAN